MPGTYCRPPGKLVSYRPWLAATNLNITDFNHPVIVDRKYGDFALNKQMKQQFGLNNQLLHAYKINFVDPFGSLSYLKGKIIICPKPTQFKKIEKSLFESVL